MTYVNEILSQEVGRMKQEILDLDAELKRMKFDAKAGNDQKEIKIDQLEKNNIEQQNNLEDMAFSVNFNIFLSLIIVMINKSLNIYIYEMEKNEKNGKMKKNEIIWKKRREKNFKKFEKNEKNMKKRKKNWR